MIGSAIHIAASGAAAELFFSVSKGVCVCSSAQFECSLEGSALCFFALFLKIGFRLWQSDLVLRRDGFPTRRVPVQRWVCASLSADDVRAACANALAPVINAAPLLLSR